MVEERRALVCLGFVARQRHHRERGREFQFWYAITEIEGARCRFKPLLLTRSLDPLVRYRSGLLPSLPWVTKYLLLRPQHRIEPLKSE